jgi:aspartate racemase
MGDLVARGAQGVVLGCTEISLLVGAGDMPGTVLYDTTALHVARAVRVSLGLQPLGTEPVSRLG